MLGYNAARESEIMRILRHLYASVSMHRARRNEYQRHERKLAKVMAALSISTSKSSSATINIES